MSGSPEKEEKWYLQDILEEAMTNASFDERNTAYTYYRFENKLDCPTYYPDDDDDDPNVRRLEDQKNWVDPDTKVLNISTSRTEEGLDKGWGGVKGGIEEDVVRTQKKNDVMCTPEKRAKIVAWIATWYERRKRDLRDKGNSKGGITAKIKRLQVEANRLRDLKEESPPPAMHEYRKQWEAVLKDIDYLKDEKLPSIEKDMDEIKKRLGMS